MTTLGKSAGWSMHVQYAYVLCCLKGMPPFYVHHSFIYASMIGKYHFQYGFSYIIIILNMIITWGDLQRKEFALLKKSKFLPLRVTS